MEAGQSSGRPWTAGRRVRDSAAALSLEREPSTSPTIPSSTCSGSISAPSVGTPSSPNSASVRYATLSQDVEPLYVTSQDEHESLRREFDAMASEGVVTVDDLLQVFENMGLKATPAEVRELLGVGFDDLLDDRRVNYEDALEALRKVRSRGISAAQADGGPKPDEKASGRWQRLCAYISYRKGWQTVKTYASFRRKKAELQAFDTITPSNRLFIAVLLISTVSLLTLASVAVTFLLSENTASLEDILSSETSLVKEAITSFAAEKYVESYEDWLGSTTKLLSSVIDEVGYQAAMDSRSADLSFTHQLLGQTFSSTFQFYSLSMAKTGAASFRWVETAWGTFGAQATIQLVNDLNRNAEGGTEVVLGRLRNDGSIEFLTEFRYRTMCATVCGASPNAAAPMKAALSGASGSLVGNDYRPHPVYAGYTALDSIGIGLVYKVDVEVLQRRFISMITEVMDTVNAQRSGSAEIVLGKKSGAAAAGADTLEFLTKLRFCDEACQVSLSTDGWTAVPLRKALAGETGRIEGADYRGVPVLAAFGPLKGLDLGFVVKVDRNEVEGSIREKLVSSVNAVNRDLNGTEELVLVNNADAGAGEYLTEPRFRAECANATCQATNPGLAQCQRGSRQDVDYRDTPVALGYSCIAPLEVSVGYKVDIEQIHNDSVNLTVNFINNRNVRQQNTWELIVAERNPGVAPENVSSPADFTFLTEFKHRDECHGMVCGGEGACAAPMVNALQKKQGIIFGKDYRPVDVIAAHDYIDSLDLGLVSKIDAAEANAPVVGAALKLAAISAGLVTCGALVMVLVMKYLLKFLEKAWGEGKAVVEREKQQFQTLVKSLYPAEVAARLLEGETQIVYQLPDACVFFSDIHGFTSSSTQLTFDELVNFLTYTFGVMDTIADWFNVYKIKTIGDSYLALTGLPNDKVKTTRPHFVDMLYFASTCAEVFSDRFRHPDRGTILAVLASRMSHIKKRTHFSANQKAKNPNTIKKYALNEASHTVQCAMRYGMAMGPVTAGVLQGKTPQFDIWGTTVNLASRMESTGSPGRIQVSESVYHAVKDLQLPFLFSASHSSFCKGFGNVQAYFMEASASPPPDELLQKLQLRPNYGLFYFDGMAHDQQRRSGDLSSRTSSETGSYPYANGHLSAASKSATKSSHSASSDAESLGMQTTTLVEVRTGP